MLQEFTCPKNPDVQAFLTQNTKAIRFEEIGAARTYLILNKDAQILGYFSVTFKELSLLDKNISKTEVKKLDGISKNAESIRAFLIGQIGKNFSIENNPIDLPFILNEVYSVLSDAKALIGGRIIILECENTSKLISLYEAQGFKLIDDPVNELRTMYIHIAE